MWGSIVISLAGWLALAAFIEYMCRRLRADRSALYIRKYRLAMYFVSTTTFASLYVPSLSSVYARILFICAQGLVAGLLMRERVTSSRPLSPKP